MKTLQDAIEGPVSKITIEPTADGFRWSLFDGLECTFSADAEGDQIPAMLESTGIIVQTQLGIVPEFMREESHDRHAACHPSTN